MTDYIDAIQWDNVSNTARTHPAAQSIHHLRYANQTARLYVGVDLRPTAAGQHRLGEFGLKGLLSYVRGKTPTPATICTTSCR